MAKKVTPSQVANEVDNIVLRFSGKSIAGWVQEAWEKSQKTTFGQAAAGVERAARALDSYAILGLPTSASKEQVKSRYRELAKVFHPDKEGGYEGAMKLLNNAYQEIMREKGGD